VLGLHVFGLLEAGGGGVVCRREGLRRARITRTFP
jgi:hypothetical protein